MYSLATTDPATAAPVTDAALDAHLRLEGDATEIANAQAYAAAVAAALEARGLVPLRTGYTLTVDPGRWALGVSLPRVPVQAVTAVRFVTPFNDDADEAVSPDLTTGAATYTVIGAEVVTAGTLPTTGHVEIDFEAGHGASVAAATAADVPPEIREALLRETATLYENREDKVLGTVAVDISPLTTRLVMGALPVSF